MDQVRGFTSVASPAASEGRRFPLQRLTWENQGAVRMGGSETPGPGPFSAVLGKRAGQPLTHMRLITGPTEETDDSGVNFSKRQCC